MMTGIMEGPHSAVDGAVGTNPLAESGTLSHPNPKAQKILAGARAAFHDLGYEGTSVDEIARRACVSKPTVYNHFADKEALFAASFTHECQEQALRAYEGGDARPGDCIEAGLRRVAHYLVGYLLSPAAQSSFRIAVAESKRFPKLGRAYYEAGIGLGVRRIEALLADAVKQGTLEIDDLGLASHQFVELCKADAYNKQLFSVGEKPTEQDISRVAEGAVNVFFKGYRAHR